MIADIEQAARIIYDRLPGQSSPVAIFLDPGFKLKLMKTDTMTFRRRFSRHRGADLIGVYDSDAEVHWIIEDIRMMVEHIG